MRLLNRLLAALLALALLGLALLIVIEVAAHLLNDGPALVPYDTWVERLRTVPWTDTVVRLVAIGAALVGLLLLLSALTARDRRFVLPTELPDLTLTTSPRAVARMLRRRAEMVSGVSSATAVVGRHRARVEAVVPFRDPDQAEYELNQVLSQALGSVPWKHHPTLWVAVQSRHEHEGVRV